MEDLPRAWPHLHAFASCSSLHFRNCEGVQLPDRGDDAADACPNALRLHNAENFFREAEPAAARASGALELGIAELEALGLRAPCASTNCELSCMSNTSQAAQHRGVLQVVVGPLADETAHATGEEQLPRNAERLVPLDGLKPPLLLCGHSVGCSCSGPHIPERVRPRWTCVKVPGVGGGGGDIKVKMGSNGLGFACRSAMASWFCRQFPPPTDGPNKSTWTGSSHRLYDGLMTQLPRRPNYKKSKWRPYHPMLPMPRQACNMLLMPPGWTPKRDAEPSSYLMHERRVRSPPMAWMAARSFEHTTQNRRPPSLKGWQDTSGAKCAKPAPNGVREAAQLVDVRNVPVRQGLRLGAYLCFRHRPLSPCPKEAPHSGRPLLLALVSHLPLQLILAPPLP